VEGEWSNIEPLGPEIIDRRLSSYRYLLCKYPIAATNYFNKKNYKKINENLLLFLANCYYASFYLLQIE
jgi:hypothetical protein